MTILIADKLAEDAIASLREAGLNVHVDAGLSGDALAEALAAHAPQVLVVRSTKVTAAHLDASPALELVVRAGAGVDTIDMGAASARGIYVANCPGKNADAVAELAFGLILAMDRRLPDNVALARAGKWDKAAFSKAAGVRDKTLGLIGLGSIGMGMIVRARAFGMKVTAWSRSLTPERAEQLGIGYAASPVEVARAADVISLHVASTPDTQHLVDAAFLDAMKPGALLVNTARDAVVDEEALAHALDAKGLRYATDVPSGEPSAKTTDFLHPLAAYPNVYITHHIGASTEQASDAIGREAIRIIRSFAETGRVPNVVNLAAQTPATHLLTVRHRDRVGVLAGVLDVMRRAGWNVHEMENLVFEGAEAAVARIRIDGLPRDEVIAAIAAQEHVLAVAALPV